MADDDRGMAVAVELVARWPLAWVIAGDLSASPLPLLAEIDADGRIASFLGHCANRNPLLAAFARDPRAIVLFDGPRGYVSPTLVSRADWAPTWNYAALRFEVDVEIVPDETPAALELLLDSMEPDPGRWTVDDMGPRYEPMLARITAFRAHVRVFDPRLKLGQDEGDVEFAEIVERHPDRALAAWMKAVADR